VVLLLLLLLLLYKHTVWVKNPPPEILLHFSPNGWEFLVQILHAYYMFLPTLNYKFLFNYLQLWPSYAILSATTIIYVLKMFIVDRNARWVVDLIWHNFVTVGDNWIKICIPAYMWTFNRCVKFWLKIHRPNCLGKMSENASLCFSQWWTFCSHDVN